MLTTQEAMSLGDVRQFGRVELLAGTYAQHLTVDGLFDRMFYAQNKVDALRGIGDSEGAEEYRVIALACGSALTAMTMDTELNTMLNEGNPSE